MVRSQAGREREMKMELKNMMPRARHVRAMDKVAADRLMQVCGEKERAADLRYLRNQIRLAKMARKGAIIKGTWKPLP